LEQKLEVVTRRLELLEIAIASGRYSNNGKPRRQAYPYQQSSVELQALAAENLALRLGLTASYLASEKQRLSEKDFVNWSRNRDPRSIGWRFDPKDSLYHPVPQ
jgi:DNA-binding MarR family transcriptional regulator